MSAFERQIYKEERRVEENGREEGKRKKIAEMRFERIVIKGLASFQGQTRIPENPLDRELSGLDEIRLFVIRSYMFSFFLSFF